MEQRKKEICINLAVLLGTIFIFFLCFEIVLRVSTPDATVFSQLDLITYNTISGISFKPKIDTIYNSRVDTKYHITTNSLGWRDDEPHANKTTTRIEIFGDSFTAGLGVDQEAMFTEVLEHDLLKNSSEVLSFALGGMGTGHAYHYFDQVGRSYDPDVVVLVFYLGNDWYDNFRNDSTMPYFTLENNTLLRHNFPPEEREFTENPYPFPLNVHAFLSEHMYTYNFIYKALFGLPSVRNFLEHTSLGKMGFAPPSYELYQNGALYQESVPITTQLLATFKEEVEREGSTFMVIMLPTRVQVNDNEWENLRKGTTETLDRTLPNTKLTTICTDLEITCVDLLPAFRRQTAQGEQLYFNIDPHTNEEGHKLIAKEICIALTNQTTQCSNE